MKGLERYVISVQKSTKNLAFVIVKLILNKVLENAFKICMGESEQ